MELPVIRLPIDLPLYRADNGRLIMQLEDEERRLGLSRGYYSTQQESRDVQARLHALLLELSRDPTGPIYQELAHQARQTEPLLVTADGLVVNGNRRLAAMRELLAYDAQKYASFQQIRAAALPSDAGTEDIEYVEAALQLAPETKLAYSWINRRLKLRRQKQELGLPVDRIVQSYRLQNAGQLEQELQELELAEDYLQNYLGRPNEYALVLDAEKLFTNLWANLQALPAEYGDVWRLTGFAMISGRQELDVDLSSYYPFAQPKPANLPRLAMFRLAGEYELIPESVRQEQPELNNDVIQDLLPLLANQLQALELARTVLSILDQLHMEQREHNTPKRLLKHLRQARQLLEEMQTEERGPLEERGPMTEDRGPLGEGRPRPDGRKSREAGIRGLARKQRAQLQSELAAILAHSRHILGPDEALPLVGGYAERADGLDPDRPSLKAGLAHALRALLGPRLCRRIGGSLRGPKTEDRGLKTED